MGCIPEHEPAEPRVGGREQSVREAHRPAVLLVTHDVDEAIVLADRVIVLDGGVVRTDVRVDRDRPRDELRAFLLAELGVEGEGR